MVPKVIAAAPLLAGEREARFTCNPSHFGNRTGAGR
jgi:hypothetical protein